MAQIIPGFHSVLEALSFPDAGVVEVWIASGKEGPRAQEIRKRAATLGIPVLVKARKELDQELPGISHQGFIAIAREFKYTDLDKIVSNIKKLDEYGLLIATDHITDEGNLASLIRTSAFFGAHGLIIPKRRSARVSYKVIKRSSGTHMILPISQVTNLGRAIDTLIEAGYWIIGTSGHAESTVYEFDWNRDIVLVVGNEQKGMSEGIRRRCQAIVSIPSVKGIESLNVSVAAGVVLSEIFRQRRLAPSSGQGKSGKGTS